MVSCAPLLTKASLVKPDSHMHARTRAWTTIKVQSSNSEHMLAVESREWLSTASLVIFPRLMKYPTNLSVISFQDASLASPKLSIALSGIIVWNIDFWVIFSCMFLCPTCISLKWICVWEATRSSLRSNFHASRPPYIMACFEHYPSSLMEIWPDKIFFCFLWPWSAMGNRWHLCWY